MPKPIPAKQFRPPRKRGPHFPSQDILSKVRATVNRHPEGLTLSQLSDEADIRWETAVKYVDALKPEVTTQKVGNATLVRRNPDKSPK